MIIIMQQSWFLDPGRVDIEETDRELAKIRDKFGFRDKNANQSVVGDMNDAKDQRYLMESLANKDAESDHFRSNLSTSAGLTSLKSKSIIGSQAGEFDDLADGERKRPPKVKVKKAKKYVRKKRKNMHAPKQPLSAYNLFFRDRYEEMKGGDDGHSELIQKISAMWRTKSPDVLENYESLA